MKIPQFLQNLLQKYSKKQILITAISIVLVLVIANKFLHPTKNPLNLQPVVKTQVISLADHVDTKTYAGEIRGKYENQLSFQASGKIIKRNVELGSRVQAGDIIMELDPKDVRQTVNTTQAAVSAAQAQLNLAEKNLERFQTLFDQQAVSRLQLDNAQLQYASAQASYRQASAQYQQSDNLLSYTGIKVDYPGVISNIFAEVGQVVAAGQPIATLVRDNELEVEINIPEHQLVELKQAKTIRITLWALNNTVLNGTVREISPMADPVTKTYKARITIASPPPTVQLGMTAAVNISNSTATGFSIPLTAIYQTGEQPQVWLVVNEQTKLQPVTLGRFIGDKIEVLSGLNDQDRVVVAGVHKLREGQKVRLYTGD